MEKPIKTKAWRIACFLGFHPFRYDLSPVLLVPGTCNRCGRKALV